MDRVQNWKAGDVAMLVTESGAEHVGMVVTTGLSIGVIAPTYQALSAIHRDRRDAVIYAWGPSAIRPLVVIDPEDREQVERLAWAIKSAYWGEETTPVSRGLLDATQAAFRSLANPTPPIEEPTGLGAVVEDVDGKRWVRNHGFSLSWQAEGERHRRRFDDIKAVRVLSEGIPAEAKS